MVSLLTKLTGISGGIPVEKLYPIYKTPESKLLEIEGMPLHYRVTGTGPALLLVHGVCSSLHTWKDWQEILSEHFQVISFDVPSFGLTGPHPKKDYTIEMYMRVMNTLLDHLGINQFYMAGNSFGGFLTWHYAIRYPERLRKMVLLDAAGVDSLPEHLKVFGFKLFIQSATKFIAHRVTPKPILSATLCAAYGDDSKITNELVELYWHMLLREGNRPGFSEVLGKTILHGKDNKPLIKKVKIPTLILWGDKDRVIPVNDAHIFKDLIPHAQKIIYEGVGHMPMEEIPQQSAADTLAFLQA